MWKKKRCLDPKAAVAAVVASFKKDNEDVPAKLATRYDMLNGITGEHEGEEIEEVQSPEIDEEDENPDEEVEAVRVDSKGRRKALGLQVQRTVTPALASTSVVDQVQKGHLQKKPRTAL